MFPSGWDGWEEVFQLLDSSRWDPVRLEEFEKYLNKELEKVKSKFPISGVEMALKGTGIISDGKFQWALIPPEIEVPQGGELLADSPTWINRFSVPSESSNVNYTVSQNRKGRWWACSCRGFTQHTKKHCKHLKKVGLPGGQVPFEARIAITAAALPKSILRVAPGEEINLPKPRRTFALPEEDL